MPLADNFTPLLHMKGTIGPLANTVDDIVTGLKVILNPNAHKYDPLTAPGNWRQEEYDRAVNGKVNIGYVLSYSTIPAHAS